MPNLNRVLFGLGAVFGIAALIGVLIFAHTRAVSKYGKERYEAGKADAYAAVEHKAHEIELKATALAAKLRGNTDAQIGTVNRYASALRVRGPGKAICTGTLEPSAAASGHVAASRATDVTVDRLLDAERRELLAVPYLGAVAFAGQCDANRLEVIAWRTQHEQSGTPNGAH